MGRFARTTGNASNALPYIHAAHPCVHRSPPQLYVLGIHSLFSLSCRTHGRLWHEQLHARAVRGAGDHLWSYTNSTRVLDDPFLALLADGGLARWMMACTMGSFAAACIVS